MRVATSTVRQPVAAAVLALAVLAIPVLAGATSGAAAASGGTVIATAPGPFGTMLVVGGSTPATDFALYYITSDQPPTYGCLTKVIKLPGGSSSCTGKVTDKNAE